MYAANSALYRDLVEFAPDALILVDAQGTVLYANTHAHTLFQYEPGTLNGFCVDQLIPEESRSSHAAHRDAYTREPRLREMGNRGMALFGLRRDGTRFPAEVRLAPIRTPEGFVFAAVRDASESEKLLSMLADARRSAEEANEAKGRLLAAASHDLRQPMQSLRLLNGTLKRMVHDANVVEVLEQEERALETMSELLHALLNIAKLESGTLRPTISDVAIVSVFEDLRQQFAALLRLKNLDLQIDTPNLHVRTDPILLRELLQNLLANAVRYTDSGHIALRCALDRPGIARIEVADTGVGIPQALQQKIFEDFFQAAAPRDKAHRGGTGLGLGIVRRIAQVLNIPVRVDSTVGAGTRFTIEVAANEVEAALEPGAAMPAASPHTHGKPIILVEDDRAMRAALKLYLQLDAHEVHTAGSLSELDELLDKLGVTPAIVISDFHLGPCERGSDAIEKVRSRFSRALPAILLTGDTSAVPARIASGTDIRMLNKPVDARRLSTIIDELLQPSQ